MGLYLKSFCLRLRVVLGLPWWFCGKEYLVNAGDTRDAGQEYSLEKAMATHSSILAWKTPWTEEPGELQFIGSQESNMTLRVNNSNMAQKGKGLLPTRKFG